MNPPDAHEQPTLRRTYRYRLYPSKAQDVALDGHLAQACDLYNAALEHRRRMWRDHGVGVTFYDQSAELPAMRSDGLLSGNSWSQQDVLRRLDHAFQAFFRRCKAGENPGYPRFRSKARYDTLAWTFAGHAGGVALNGNRLRIQGVGHVNVKMHRPIPEGGVLCDVHVSRRNGRWYAAFSVKDITCGGLPRACSRET